MNCLWIHSNSKSKHTSLFSHCTIHIAKVASPLQAKATLPLKGRNRRQNRATISSNPQIRDYWTKKLGFIIVWSESWLWWPQTPMAQPFYHPPHGPVPSLELWRIGASEMHTHRNLHVSKKIGYSQRDTHTTAIIFCFKEEFRCSLQCLIKGLSEQISW